MKKTKQTLLAASAAIVLLTATQSQADSWAFDGSKQQIQAAVSEAQALRAQQNLFAEVYQNQVMCWSWDACVDKPRVYGVVYDTYAFN
ncbi:MAG: hypothetical protein IE937_06275 [Gammaproteobacteria bacterium]|nr:hypothetical protein [Gammaproteobacteria bacterium]MBD3775787.1 hypothetical protein [Thiotrichales bacterium]